MSTSTTIPPLVEADLAEMLADPLALFWRGYERHGHIFRVDLFGQEGTVLLGPEHHELFFRQVDQNLSVVGLYDFVVPMFGEVLLALHDQAQRRAEVALIGSAFSADRLAGHVRPVEDETASWLDSLGAAGRFDIWDTIEALAVNISAAALLGPETRSAIEQYRPLLLDLARGMDPFLPPDLPLEKFRRRDAAREQLIELITPVIAARRVEGHARDDFLQALVEFDGRRYDDDKIVGLALCTLFTGFITTAAQLSWSLALLVEHEEYLQSVVDEVRVGGAGPGSARLTSALLEAQRLRPVMTHYARRTVDDYEVGGFRVAAGSLTILCPAVAHRLPEVFDQPDRYWPQRFDHPQLEHRRHPYSLIPFGGGFYRCPGSQFGHLEMSTVIARLIERYDLTLVDPVTATMDVGVLRPASPCRLSYSSAD